MVEEGAMATNFFMCVQYSAAQYHSNTTCPRKPQPH